MGRSGESVECLKRRRVGICCLQETKWKGNGTRLLGVKEVFWKGIDEGTAEAGVGVLIADKWSDKVVDGWWIEERLMVVRVIVGRHLMSLISAYAP
jgi:hypothetical protein